nr:YMR253C [Saccharomyces cerevisiae]
MNPSVPKVMKRENNTHLLVSKEMNDTSLQLPSTTRSLSPKESNSNEDFNVDGNETTLQRISKDYLKPNIGLVLLTVSYFFNSAMVVSTKVLENDPDDIANDRQIKPLQILLVRMVITYIGTLIYMYINKSTISDVPFGKPEVRKWLVLRGCTGFFGVFGMYYSLMYLTISDAVLITFLAPSLTIFLSWVILRERFTKVEALGSLISLLGVVLIVRPSFLFGTPELTDSSSQIVESSDPKSRLIATLVGLWGVLGMSCVYIIIRYIGKRAHAIMSVSYLSLITAIVSFIGINTIPSMKFQIPHSKKQWILFGNLGVSGFIFQLLLTMGIQRERAGRGSLMTYTQLLYAVFWDVALYKHWPNIWSWIGMIIIISATLWVIRIRAANNETTAKDLTPIIDDEENSIPLTEFDLSDSK